MTGVRKVAAAVLARSARHPHGRQALTVAAAAFGVFATAFALGWVHRAWMLLAVPAWLVFLVAGVVAVAYGKPDTTRRPPSDQS
jgi:MFS superfamily sulfate permease-like transporter